MKHATRVLLATLVTLAVQASGAELDDLEKLLNIGDEAFEPVTRPLSAPPFTHRKSITISAHSLTNGWVANHQCHEHFATMPALQIVFHSETVRGIRIDRTKKVGRAWVDGTTVQMEKVNPETELCLHSDNRLLVQTGPERYQLRVGPFYHRYLDGYFPLHMELKIAYPSHLLRVVDMTPEAPAIKINREAGRIRLESLFQGKLWITVLFAAAKNPLSKPH